MLYIDINANDINLGIDVDGTLTKDKIGNEMLTLSVLELKKKFSQCTPKEGIEILSQNKFNVHIITGRHETYRQVTEDWLDTYGISYNDLTMFPDDFYILNGYSMPKYVELKLDIHIQKNIHFSLDDNELVIDVLNEHGIPACIVKNNFRDAFEKVFELNGSINSDIVKGKYKRKIPQSQISRLLVG